MTGQEEEKRESKKIKDSVRSLWDKFKSLNIPITGVLEGEEKAQEIGNYLKNNERKIP